MKPGREAAGEMTPYNTKQELQIKIMPITREWENADTYIKTNILVTTVLDNKSIL